MPPRQQLHGSVSDGVDVICADALINCPVKPSQRHIGYSALVGSVVSRRVNPLGGFVMEMACATRLSYQPKQIPPLVAHVSSLLDPTQDAGYESPDVPLDRTFGGACAASLDGVRKGRSLLHYACHGAYSWCR